MANVNITDLTALTDPATADEIEVYDASASQNKRLALSRLVRNDGNGAQITGGGTIALGGYTLTVPATGTAALLGTTNIFSVAQTIRVVGNNSELFLVDNASGEQVVFQNNSAAADWRVLTTNGGSATTKFSMSQAGLVSIGTLTRSGQLTVKAGSAGTIGMVVEAAASPSANIVEIRANGGTVLTSQDYRSTVGYRLNLPALDMGGNRGRSLYLGRDTDAANSGASAAAAHLQMERRGGTTNYVWIDNSGDMRTGTTLPTSANDTSGTVVGTQTSQVATKDILGAGVDPAAALATILATPVYRFRYKNGAYNDTEFHGITTDSSPEFGMDEGRVFNPVSAFGFTVQAIKALMQRIEQMEAQL